MLTKKVNFLNNSVRVPICKQIAYYLANNERTRKFALYNENIMFNIYLTFAAFPTPLPYYCLLPLKKHSNVQKLVGGYRFGTSVGQKSLIVAETNY
jgi:hypothetical protein